MFSHNVFNLFAASFIHVSLLNGFKVFKYYIIVVLKSSVVNT